MIPIHDSASGVTFAVKLHRVLSDEVQMIFLAAVDNRKLFADKLKLSREQREQTNSALAAAMQESTPARADMDNSRVAFASALIDGKSADGLSCAFSVPANASPTARCAAIKKQCGGKFVANYCGDKLLSAM